MSLNASGRPGDDSSAGGRRPGAAGRGARGLGRGLSAGAAVILLVAAASALGLQQLPSGGRVNDDLASGINKAISVAGDDPTNADVVGGALVAGKPAVPWAIFRQRETNSSPPPHDQIFSRSFAGGAWTTRGIGTVGGRSSASPQFRGSLNFDQGQDGEAPAIDFAGAGRTVPWATWYENTTGTGFATNNVFASRFDNTGDANQNKWIFAGQNRGTGGGSVQVPSLNIHTNQDAENPSVAGGSAVDPTKPGPWITWQETTSAPTSGRDQIFVERPIGPASANCDGVTPAGVAISGHVPAIGGFCWQQTGVPRVGPGSADPSLNVDPTRNGIEPDIAFTGSNDSVPWVVWYEKDNTSLGGGLRSNELVFAAKGVSDGVAANGGFHWVVVGSQLSGTLDTTGTNAFGTCAASGTNEQQCSLNHDATRDAEDPRVAAGAMTAGNPTVPWVAWDENVSGVNHIFVSRLVGTGTSAHFQIANNGAAISSSGGDTRPDITFSGNTPYVTWRANVGGVIKGFVGHFINASNPTFVLDQSNIPLTPTSLADVREPISSGCTANPFNSDGAACQGGARGTPFFLFTNGTSPLGLFAGAYQPSSVVTGKVSNVTSSSATVSGLVNPLGASAAASFQFGTTTAYGSTTAAQKTPLNNITDTITATLSGLAAGTTIHYRVVISTDFGTFFGADQAFLTTGGGAFNRTAKLLKHGHKVRASGPATVCKRGEKIFLTVKIKQGKTTALGTWSKHGCTGKARQWHVVLTVKGHGRLHKGTAIGHGRAKITLHGHTVKIWRWSRKVKLVG